MTIIYEYEYEYEYMSIYIYEHIVFECFDGFRWGYDDLFSVEMYINTYICIYTRCIHTYMHACIHTYIDTYIQTNIHTYMIDVGIRTEV